MRAAILGGALLLSALTLAAAACRQTESAGAQKDPFADVPRVKVEELAAALREGRAVAVDVRPVEAFEEEHIPGAFSIPEEEVVARASELPKDKLVVAYCA